MVMASQRGSAPDSSYDRLVTLVDQGILRKEPYREPGTRTRHEYRLTEMGLELQPVLLAIGRWGDRHLADPAGPPVVFAHRECEEPVHVEVRCAAGHLVDDPRRVATRPGPGVRPFAG